MSCENRRGRSKPGFRGSCSKTAAFWALPPRSGSSGQDRKRGGRALALSKNWPLGGGKGSSGRGQFSVRSASAAVFKPRKNFLEAQAEPENFCGKVLARPRPTRKAASVPNAEPRAARLQSPDRSLPAAALRERKEATSPGVSALLPPKGAPPSSRKLQQSRVLALQNQSGEAGFGKKIKRRRQTGSSARRCSHLAPSFVLKRAKPGIPAIWRFWSVLTLAHDLLGARRNV